MRNKILIKSCIVDKENKIIYDYEIIGEWKKYFKGKQTFFAQYSLDISKTPESVLVIPLLCDILPLAWICDAQIMLNEIDENFLGSIPEIKKGYEVMYPMLSFNGELMSAKAVPHGYAYENKCAVFFTGGVDAYSTLISNILETPSLISVWGADIDFSDIKGWKRRQSNVNAAAFKFGTEAQFIKSNFKNIFNHKMINKLIRATHETWWHGFQHGLGLLGLAAPYTYTERIGRLFIASTYSEKDDMKHRTCASDPSIDNNVRFCGTEVVHDGYEISRLDKYDKICEFANDNGYDINLHVCFIASGAVNCCTCEKCLRTIFGMMAKGHDPRRYGFDYKDKNISGMAKKMKSRIILKKITSEFWNDIKNTYEKGTVENKDLEWIRKFDFNEVIFENKSYLEKVYLRLLQFTKIYSFKIFGK